MADTSRIELPLVAAAQAQKHVTVNEALTRLDTVVQLSVATRSETVPPAIPVEGDCYLIASGAADAWAGQDGKIAGFVNGGWIFITPGRGWSLFVEDETRRLLFDGADWHEDTLSLSPGGALFKSEIAEADVTLSAGSSVLTGFLIPPRTCVMGVTGRVISEITGTLSAWRLGVDGSDDRYGNGLGLAQNSWVIGLTGAPMSYYDPTRLLLSAEGGDFTGGQVRLAVHLLRIELPDPV